jgi:hypothetical protein
MAMPLRSIALRRTALPRSISAIVAAIVYVSQHLGLPPHRFDPRDSTQARQQVTHDRQENSVLEATISRLEHTLAEQQHETESLRAQVATFIVAANDAQSPEEYAQKTQEKLLADTRAELAGLKKSHASDQASIVADQYRINELYEQLKTARANAINAQRQLVTAGGDVPNLMGARQLHVVDVRDTDPNGKPGKAFGRIFLTEGKSLVFYAFDLNDLNKNDAKKTFQVWGQQGGKSGSLRSLGFLNIDNKTQQRRALKTNDAAAFKQIDSVFVTVEPKGGAKTPTGKRLLFAYLGEANHP